ncbi:putative FAS1 domain-containing protein [Lupinus albus]|uniref:Putative FAS1 domain-containing protein n=1 Tax=Lupinus albus TaxID=3870 RepID=A0A6A4Q9B2_LUPAL|nr:putative FAS1 domain-containing protein [Lupinus albus]
MFPFSFTLKLESPISSFSVTAMENFNSFLRFTLLFAAILSCGSIVTSTNQGFEASFTPSTHSSPPPPTPHDHQEHSLFSHTALLPPILSHLGFHNLATAAPSLSDSASPGAPSTWTGPSTIFAPSDASLRTCFSCSIPNLLREHMVPGLFTIDYLRQLAFGTKIETLSPGRCITVTSDSVHPNTNSTATAKVFIGGVEITQPDLFNNGMIVVHGIHGFISPLSPFSCDVERMTSLSFPFHPDRRSGQHLHTPGANAAHAALMRLMLRDAMLRLRNNGFSILALAMKVKYAELVTLSNMTIFAVDDLSIFSGSQSYIHNVRFHVVPNRYLSIADLEKLPVGTHLPTLERGQPLLITTSGGGTTFAPMRINYVRIKTSDVIRNVRIMVHSVYLPFPHINPVAAAYDSILGGGGVSEGTENMPHEEGTCTATADGEGSCGVSPMAMPEVQVKPVAMAMVEIEDHHGLLILFLLFSLHCLLVCFRRCYMVLLM